MSSGLEWPAGDSLGLSIPILKFVSTQSFEDGMFKADGQAFIGFVGSQTNPQREQGPH